MDKARAKAMTAELQGKSLNGWLVQDYIDCGKSALVLRAEKNGVSGAIKIFDRELIERFGREVQTERIRREVSLIGKQYPHLIDILDGGYDSTHDAHFVVMNFFAGSNLEKMRERIPRENMRGLISQVASAARYLETLNLVHRDIKPSNIGIDIEGKHASLLDLGVIRPIGAGSATDNDAARVFIGTLQYSSPEFLLREEIDSIEGWRAVTFYQLGGVLHDLIMRKPLLGEFSQPFVKLANAVQNHVPEIKANDVAEDLLELTRNCLVKNPATRLKLVNWDSFDPNPSTSSRVNQIKQRIAARRLRGPKENKEAIDRSTLTWKLNNYASEILSVFRYTCIGDPDFPPLTVTDATVLADHATRFSVNFEPSKRHSLAGYLQIIIQLRWIDLSDDVVSIDVGATLASSSASIEIDTSLSLVNIYTGKFVQDAIAVRLQDLLYIALDWAQATQPNPDSLLTLGSDQLIGKSI